MSNKNIERQHHQTFEELKQIGDGNAEFWNARDLQVALDYSSWDKFKRVILKAITACEKSGQTAGNHFSQVGKMVQLGSGSQREIEDYRLSRYACYLIVQNGDPSKPIIANGQTYFAIQTRRQELADDETFQRLKEDEKRLFLRNEMKEHNKKLVEAAQQAGVESNLDFAIFQNHGYKGLYGGLDAKGIHQHKGLKKSQQILDNMGSTELAANLFRATQTEEKLRRENVQGKTKANTTHFEVGKKVRQTIEELGGTMPEERPLCPRCKKPLSWVLTKTYYEEVYGWEYDCDCIDTARLKADEVFKFTP
jgi:DNA-damage-inducible protein D